MTLNKGQFGMAGGLPAVVVIFQMVDLAAVCGFLTELPPETYRLPMFAVLRSVKRFS